MSSFVSQSIMTIVAYVRLKVSQFKLLIRRIFVCMKASVSQWLTL